MVLEKKVFHGWNEEDKKCFHRWKKKTFQRLSCKTFSAPVLKLQTQEREICLNHTSKKFNKQKTILQGFCVQILKHQTFSSGDSVFFTPLLVSLHADSLSFSDSYASQISVICGAHSIVSFHKQRPGYFLHSSITLFFFIRCLNAMSTTNAIHF